jgi:DNA mismatch endonuclease, patch repair protein
MKKRKDVPAASSAAAKKRMQSTGQRDTVPEIELRLILHRMGLRYRIDRKPIPQLRRRADIVFVSARVAVYIDGCFWHGCPLHATWPKANAAFWRKKIEANRLRDSDTNSRLAEAGWMVIRIWEHEDPQTVAQHIANTVRQRRSYYNALSS